MRHFNGICAILAFLLSSFILVVDGCGPKQPATLRPGALNAFDSATFDTLVTAQAALETASKEVTAFPAVKPELNKAIDLFNAAEISYKAYHEALAAGKPTDQASLDKLIRNLTVAVASAIDKIRPLKPIPVSPPVALSLTWRMA